MVTALNKMKQQLVFENLAHLHCIEAEEDRAQVSDANTVFVKSKKYTIYSSPSRYISRYIVYIGSSKAYIHFLHENVVCIGTAGEEWTEAEIRDFFTDEFLSKIKRNIEMKTNLGTKHEISGKILVWDFYTYQVYYKG